MFFLQPRWHRSSSAISIKHSEMANRVKARYRPCLSASTFMPINALLSYSGIAGTARVLLHSRPPVKEMRATSGGHAPHVLLNGLGKRIASLAASSSKLLREIKMRGWDAAKIIKFAESLTRRCSKLYALSSNFELRLENGVLENNDPRASSSTQMSGLRVYRK
jgi:hypothetical protein